MMLQVNYKLLFTYWFHLLSCNVQSKHFVRQQGWGVYMCC